jgi:hypothetical protein
MGRQDGDEVTVQIPVGRRVLSVVKIVTIHDKEEQG